MSIRISFKMREIKFRAWHEKTKEMLKVITIDFRKKEANTINPSQYKGTRYSYDSFGVGGIIVLMQLTGLKDKNGKEIFEGDIVKFGSLDKIGTIIFYNGCFIIEDLRFEHENKLYTCDDGDPDTFVEVIGNIYENPELLGADSVGEAN